MKLRKPAYGALILCIIIFSNPNFNCFDFFPDFIAAFIITSLLRRAEDVVPFLAEARSAFIKLGIVSLIRLPAAVVMFSQLHTGMDIVPLFTLVFSVLELIFLYTGILNAVRGLCYLGERSEASALIAPTTRGGLKISVDLLRNFTLVFVILRAVLNFLPQICHLTFSSERLQYITNHLYAPLEIFGLITVFAVGVIWGISMLVYLLAVKREGKVAASVEAVAGEEKLAKLNETARVRGMLASLTFLGFTSVLSFDIALKSSDSFNILPRFIFTICLLFAVLGLVESKVLRVATLISAIGAAVVSTVGYILTRGFSDKYDIRDLMEYSVARSDYLGVEIFAVIELTVTAAFVILVGVILCRLVRRHTGMSTDSEGYTLTAKRHHTELCRRVYILVGILLVATVFKCVQIFLIGSPVATRTESESAAYVYSARMPWFGTVIFATNLLYTFYCFYLTGTLKDEIRMRYDIQKGV